MDKGFIDAARDQKATLSPPLRASIARASAGDAIS
jgi:hypothetical protein